MQENETQNSMPNIQQPSKWDLIEKSDRYVFSKQIQILDGRDIQLASGTGTKIGTSGSQKLSVYGVTPIAQQSAISSPAGGTTQDSQARAAINTIILTLKNFGITL